MKLVIDPHCHTVASGHAYSTVTEYADEARRCGLSLVAMTDHAPAMPCSIGEFYFHNFTAVPDEINGVRIMMGVELNILDKSGRVDLDDRPLDSIAPVIASFHPPCYRYAREGMNESEKRDEITDAMVSVMDNNYVQILGHPGDPRFPFDIDRIVRKSMETGVLLEINNASLAETGIRSGSREIIAEILHTCKRLNCPVVVGSDAHFSTAAGKFDSTLLLLNDHDFPERLVANTSLELFYSLLRNKEVW